MSKIHRIPAPYKEDEENLRDLIRQYLRKSEDLENREEQVIRQIEEMQSAITSLQGRNQRKFSQGSHQPVHPTLQEIEEETRQIREETQRIQNEVREKIEENRKLQREIEARRMQDKEHPVNLISESFMTEFDRNIENRKADRLEMETGALEEQEEKFLDAEEESSNNGEASGIQFFNEKLENLKKMRKKLKRESEEYSKLSKTRMDKLREKVEMLEYESEINQKLFWALNEKPKK